MYGQFSNIESLREVQAEQQKELMREMNRRRLLREAGIDNRANSLFERFLSAVRGENHNKAHIRPALDLQC